MTATHSLWGGSNAIAEGSREELLKVVKDTLAYYAVEYPDHVQGIKDEWYIFPYEAIDASETLHGQALIDAAMGE
jgi:hypothetical protein